MNIVYDTASGICRLVARVEYKVGHSSPEDVACRLQRLRFRLTSC